MLTSVLYTDRCLISKFPIQSVTLESERTKTVWSPPIALCALILTLISWKVKCELLHRMSIFEPNETVSIKGQYFLSTVEIRLDCPGNEWESHAVLSGLLLNSSLTLTCGHKNTNKNDEQSLKRPFEETIAGTHRVSASADDYRLNRRKITVASLLSAFLSLSLSFSPSVHDSYNRDDITTLHRKQNNGQWSLSLAFSIHGQSFCSILLDNCWVR